MGARLTILGIEFYSCGKNNDQVLSVPKNRIFVSFNLNPSDLLLCDAAVSPLQERGMEIVRPKRLSMG